MVVEAKTTEVYAIKTATLLNYINELVSHEIIKDSDQTLGLYVVGRPDPEIRQLENAIVAEKKTHRLRIDSANSLLSLAERMTEYDVTNEDILAVLRPSTPRIYPAVDLIERLVAEPPPVTAHPNDLPAPAPTPERSASPSESDEKPSYWLAPVKSVPEETAEECIQKLVGQEHIYASPVTRD